MKETILSSWYHKYLVNTLLCEKKTFSLRINDILPIQNENHVH